MDTSYRTLCDPPAPISSCLCNLPFSKDPCLVTVSGDKIQIFDVSNNKFLLVWEKKYWTDIFAVFCHKSGKEYDSIIIGCDTCKIAVLQVVDGFLSEVEFHSFEIEDVSTRLRNPTIMVSDPTGTCLALLIAGSTLFILPLVKSSIDRIPIEYPKADIGQHSGWEIVVGSIMKDLKSDFNPPLYRVRDIAFLEGYNRPTLAILHEPIPTWSARLAYHKSTVVVSIISPSIIKRNDSLDYNRTDKINMWTSRVLPHNSFSIFPIPPPFGGFLILSKNAILYMTHTNGTVIGLNSMVNLDDEVPFKVENVSQRPCELYSKLATSLDPSHILVSVDRHKFGILSLHNNGIDVSKLSLNIFEDLEFHPSTFINIKNNVVFAGSTIHDSILLKINLSFEEREISEISEFDLTSEQIQLYQKFFLELPHTATTLEISFFSIDVLTCLRQIGSVVTATPCIDIFAKDEADQSISMLMGCGFKSTGNIQLLRAGLSPNILNDYSFPDITGLYSSFNFNFIIISISQSISIYSIENEFKISEFQDYSLFIRGDQTIAAFDYGDSFIQVTSDSVRIISREYDSNLYFVDLIQKSPIKIIDVKHSNDHLVILFHDGSVSVYDSSPKKLFELTSKNNYCLAILEEYLFVMQTNGILKLYSLNNGVCEAIFEQFKAFPDQIKPIVKEEGSITSSNILLVDMNFLEFESMKLLVMLSKEGPTFFYQWYPEIKSFHRLKMGRWNITVDKKAIKHSSIYKFDKVSGFSGGFISGTHPFFVIEENCYPRIISSSPKTFLPRYFSLLPFLNNNNIFAYSDNNQLYICNFSNISHPEENKWRHEGTFLIDGCIVKRINTFNNNTPRKIVYSPNWGSYIYLASTPIPYSTDGQKKIDPEEDLNPHNQQPPTPFRDMPTDLDGIPVTFEESYSINVLTDNYHNEVFKLDRHEIGFSLALVHTNDSIDSSGIGALSEYLAIGSGYMCNVQLVMRGKLSIYKGLISKNNEEQNLLQLQLLCDKILSNPVTAIVDNSGLIAAYTGTQIKMILFYNESSIKDVSFYVGRFFSTQILSLKNYLLSIDMYEGFDVIRWRKYGKKLISMAKDFHTYLPLSGGLLTNKSNLGGIVFDEGGNAQIFDIDEYAIPIDALIRTSSFHIGGRPLNAGHFPIQDIIEGGPPDIIGHLVWFITSTGKFGLFSPIDENQLHNLCVVQSFYENTTNGFSHHDYRTGKFLSIKSQDLLALSPKLVIDLDLMMEMLESSPEILRTSMKSSVRGLSELISILNNIYDKGAEVFE